ncbi:hypothetical protein [Chryseobacterium sp. BIGb0232]|uniref:hypothetical protein n=1 Tax=Chryseobacterium sp. BIGb0232 TaxID=2940598 RepID=UPI000F49A16E|nr:hypothetical protein [Chryseobacterium sp. BIGb0232]MCS4303956.1 hypothetical protein [Chryseobacterium sp. BIGb0232]ROS11506.1 hypothetical protein EDF65_3918 [Chryseobacterium nakagawai]
MRKILSLLAIILFNGAAFTQIGINTSEPDSSANLHVTNKTSAIRGTLLNPVTTKERSSIVSPATGLIVYDTDLKCLMTNNGTPLLPAWGCVGGNSGNTGTSEVRHFYYTFPDTILTSLTDNSQRNEVLRPAMTTMSTWLQVNDPGQVAKIPTIDGIRMDVVFISTNTNHGVPSSVRPLLVNTNKSSRVLRGVTEQSDFSTERWDWYTTNASQTYVTLKENGGYQNVANGYRMNWGSTLGSCVSLFTIHGHDGALYKATFYGYRDFGPSSNGKHRIHLILEKSKP